MKTESFFSINHNRNSNKTDLKVYQSLVRKLMYLTCYRKPNISYIIRQLRRYNSNPRVSYMQIAKQVV